MQLMRSKHLLFLFTVVSGLAACSGGNPRFNIIGNINGLPQQTVIVEQLNANDVIAVVDSQRSNADGHFELSGFAPEPGLYRLRFFPNKFILLSIDKGTLKVAAQWSNLENYTVAGSPGSENLRAFIATLREHLCDYNTMSIVMDSLRAKGNDSILTTAQADFQDLRQHFTTYVENFADTTPYEANAIFAARILNPASEINYLSAFNQSLGRRFPATKLSKDFGEYYTDVAVKKQPSKRSANAESGAMAPEISLPAPDGKMVSLSSFRGKYVLLDFWASWCGPCRGENPNVVAAYERFKSKDFTILGVSLDNKKDAWEKAIKDDGLVWTQVSDLKGWSSVAANLYAVQSIPTNFLIDPTGKIIARNLRGNELEDVLQQVLKGKEQNL
jgi:peroxiredoxin